jgi:alpha 1,3-glucosidase
MCVQAAVKLPLLTSSKPYYDYFSRTLYRGSDSGKEITVPSDLHEIPLLIQGGNIVPTRERPRRASSLMKFDPFTLRVALNVSESASGDLYLDDGESYNHEKGDLVWRLFNASKVSKKKLRISSENHVALAAGANVVHGVARVSATGDNSFAKTIAGVRVERIMVFGVADKPTKITLENGATELDWEYQPGVGAKGKKEGTAGLLVIRDPAVRIVDDWNIEVDF